MPTVFHTTDRANAILREGFHDGEGTYGFATLVLRGVFLANTPADALDGAKGDTVIAVTLPEDFNLDDHAIVTEGGPVWEYLVRAFVLNEIATLQVLTPEELEGVWEGFDLPRPIGLPELPPSPATAASTHVVARAEPVRSGTVPSTGSV